LGEILSNLGDRAYVIRSSGDMLISNQIVDPKEDRVLLPYSKKGEGLVSVSINLNCAECRRFIGHPTTLSDVYCPIECPACNTILVFTDGGWVRKKVSLEEVLNHNKDDSFRRGVFNGRGG